MSRRSTAGATSRRCSPGCTVFAWSEVLAAAELPGRDDVGALRLRTIATKDRPCADFPLKSGDDYDPAVILDLDYWVLAAALSGYALALR